MPGDIRLCRVQGGISFLLAPVQESLHYEQSGTVSEDVSGDTDTSSDESNDPNGDYDPDGDIFTAAVLLCGDGGSPVACSFLDSNAQSKRFIMCSLSPWIGNWISKRQQSIQEKKP